MTAPVPASEPRSDFDRALKHAAITGIVTFGMLLPLIGFRTVQNMRNELVLETRPLLLAVFVLIAIAGSLVRLARSHPLAAPPRRRACSGRERAPGALARADREMVHSLRARLRHPLSGDRDLGRRLRRRGEMDRQFRHPDPDLRDAGLGIEHRGRPRRPARSRLCRVLRGRRLFLRAAGQGIRVLVLDPAAARRHPLRLLGHPARLSGAAAARRLSRHRHARLRRDHPADPDQLGGFHRRLCRHQRHPASDIFRHPVQCQRRRLRCGLRPGIHAALSHDLSLLRHSRAWRC